MITEERLRSLLAEAAAEPPADGPGRVVAAALSGPPSRLPRVSPRRLVAVAAVSVVVMAAGLAGLDGDGTSQNEVAGPARSGARFVAGAGSGDERSQQYATTAPPAVPMQSPQAALPQAALPGPSSAPAGAAAPGSVVGGVPESGLARIVKTGGLELSVARGHVNDVVATIIRTATAAGGYVADSTTTETNGRTTGTITVRIPSERFEPVTAELRRMGRVHQATSGGRDVTGEYTDVEARLRTLNATRDALSQVLGDARSVGDILAVQSNLTSVQSEIEQLQGRQRVLDDQIAQASIIVSIREDGRARSSGKSGTERSSWQRAADGFTGTWSSLLAQSGTALAIVLIGAALVAMLAGLARWGRRAYARWAA